MPSEEIKGLSDAIDNLRRTALAAASRAAKYRSALAEAKRILAVRGTDPVLVEEQRTRALEVITGALQDVIRPASVESEESVKP